MRIWPRFVPRAFAIATVSLALVIASATTAFGVVTGGCTASATASKSGPIDLTTQAVWHVRTDDVVSGSGTAPREQTFVTVSAYALGVALPVLNATGKGTSGSAGPYSVSSYSWAAKTITVSGSSDNCSGYVTLIIDDVSPLATALGGGGVALGVIGLVEMFAVARGSGGVGGRLGGLTSGLLGGIGAGLALTQFELLDALNPVGLAVPAVLGLLGLFVAGSLRSREP